MTRLAMAQPNPKVGTSPHENRERELIIKWKIAPRPVAQEACENSSINTTQYNIRSFMAQDTINTRHNTQTVQHDTIFIVRPHF